MARSQPQDADHRASFFERSTWGISHWLWLSVLLAIALAMIPRGARRAIESNTNKAEDWLPDSYAESADLEWFRSHFVGESFVLVSWDGCTLGDTEKLRLLKQKLAAVSDERGAWYTRVVTGPETIATLTEAPSRLERYQAIARLEGALVGSEPLDAEGDPLGDEQRTTCLLAYLSDAMTSNNRLMRTAVEKIQEVASAECGVPIETIHMGGPPVDNVTIDIEGEKTLIRLAGLSGVVGLVLSYLCFRSWPLTGMVFFAAVVNAGMSLAIVFYYGVVEVLALGYETPLLGKTDAILMSMPAVVYVLGLSGAIHLVNYYRDERRAHGPSGSVERAVRVAWGPCLLAALTTAVGLGSLAVSDILPIRKFGVFTASGVVIGVGLLFGLLPVLLHRFPPSDQAIRGKRKERPSEGAESRPWYEPLSHFVTTRHALTSFACVGLLIALAFGLPRIQTSVQLLKLLDAECDLITDYAWLEEHLGNLVPMEVVVALEGDQLRTPDELAQDPEADAYRMTLYERTELISDLQHEIEGLKDVSRALSAATFATPSFERVASGNVRRSTERVVSTAIEEHRESLFEYLQEERDEYGAATGRELWRISARVTALGDVDYGQFVEELRDRVEPVLRAYRLRNQLLETLAQQGVNLRDAKICLLYQSEEDQTAPAGGSVEARLLTLLRRASGNPRSVIGRSTVQYAQADEATRKRFIEVLSTQDAVLTLDEQVLDGQIVADGAQITHLTETLPKGVVRETGSLVSAYTGVVPLVYKTQRELLVSLRESIAWATVLIGGVMVLVLRSPAAGLASMIPNVFPIVAVFGSLGWLGVKVDIGIMMTASVALGVAVDDTLHFVTWFGRGVRSGLDRRTATRQAYDRCATAMLQTTLIAGLGLAVFAVSTFVPTQQFGCLMITMLATALVGDLVLLPALLCGPLGRFFAPGAPAVPPGDGEPPTQEPNAFDTESSDSERTDGQSDSEPEPAQPEPADEGSVDQPSTAKAHLHRVDQPLSPANAALRSKLRALRRNQGQDADRH